MLIICCMQMQMELSEFHQTLMLPPCLFLDERGWESQIQVKPEPKLIAGKKKKENEKKNTYPGEKYLMQCLLSINCIICFHQQVDWRLVYIICYINFLNNNVLESKNHTLYIVVGIIGDIIHFSQLGNRKSEL